jgi:DNA-binding response OmpR family regulator
LGEHARILVVDDDESKRITLEAILKSEDYYAQTAENEKQAIEKTSSNYYNLALIDIRLPDMEGTELLTRMKDTTSSSTHTRSCVLAT